MVPSHPIFHEPLKVNVTFEEVPTPENYFQLAGDKKLGKTIQVWRVQTKKFPEIDPGLVSNSLGFNDSPDAEVISSGLNSKGPDSVALARHGNFFLWGFSAPPRDMTPEARKCFINAVCYIKRFDGQRPIVRKVGAGFTRDGALWSAYYLRHILDEATFRRELPPFIRDDPNQYDRYRKMYLRNFEQSYPETLRRRFGDDPEKYIAWTRDNLEYLRYDGEGYDARAVVDEDAKGLGVSNRRMEMLDRCVSMLERGDRPEFALRLLKRYTTENFADSKGWRSWLEANRGHLFFTDVGGFKWRIAPASRSTAPRPAREPDREHPILADAELSPAKVRAGEAVTLIVRVRTAPTWHIYSAEGSKGPGVATSLKLRLPEGVEAVGDWSYPDAERGQDGQMIYEGTPEFRRRLRIGPATAPGRIEVACEFGYQACDPHSCRPPEKAELVAEAEVVGSTPGR